MGQSITLALPSKYNLENVRYFLPDRISSDMVFVEECSEYQYHTEDHNASIYLSNRGQPEAVNDYSHNGLLFPSFRRLAPDLGYFDLRFGWAIRELDIIEELVLGWQGDIKELWIHGQFGEIESGPEILTLLRDGVYRTSRPRYRSIMVLSRLDIGLNDWVAVVDHAGDLYEIYSIEKDIQQLCVNAPDSTESIVLYPLNTNPSSPDDPILMKVVAEQLGHSVLGWSCFVVHFRDLVSFKIFLKLFLESFSEQASQIEIDFNFGISFDGEETLELFEMEPDWDWRKKDSLWQ